MPSEPVPTRIDYVDSLDAIAPPMLQGFFVGWRHPLPPDAHWRMLAGSDRVVLAVDTKTSLVAGFVAALTDGVQGAFITLLEVLPAYQKQGIGHGLMTRMLERLSDIQTIELMCDPELAPFYTRFGMKPASGMVLRRREP
jgi:ribosomal protein S18 acetylase RimI-like enzyme